VLTLLAGKAMVAHDTYIFSVRLHNSHNGESNPSSAGGNLTVFVEQDDSTGVDKLYNEKDDFDYWGSNARTSDDLVADTASLTKEEAYAMTFKDLRPVYVREIRFEVRMVNQSKPFPCAPDNTINVGLRLNVPLLMTCKNPSTSSYDYIPAVSITGLKGTESRASHLNVVADGPFAGLSPWDRDSGRLTVKPNTETVAGETYYFAFDVWNPSQPLVSITQLQMGVEIIQRSFASASSECAATATLSCNTTYLTGVEFGFFSSTHESRAELQPMKIRPLVVLGTTRFAQSHPYPCASNSIAVTIVLSSPLYANCTPRFTIEGLTNTLTGDPNGNEVYLDLAVVQPATLMINGTDDSSGTPKGHWLNSGVLSLWITSDLLASESGLEKGYTQFSFNFTVENWHRQKAAPTISIKANTIDPWTLEVNTWAPHTKVGGSTDLEHPLYIPQPSITKVTARQSSPYPCDQNVITLELYTTAPIFRKCLPIFRVSGLTGSSESASSPENDAFLSVTSVWTGEVAPNNIDTDPDKVEWHWSTGTVGLAPLWKRSS